MKYKIVKLTDHKGRVEYDVYKKYFLFWEKLEYVGNEFTPLSSEEKAIYNIDISIKRNKEWSKYREPKREVVKINENGRWVK